MSRHARAVRGHGAPVSRTIGSRTAMAPTNRYSRNVSGGACGDAYFATMKPVLQMSTNANGIAESQALRAVERASRTDARLLQLRAPAPRAQREADGLEVQRHRHVDVAAVAAGHRHDDRHAEPLGEVEHALVARAHAVEGQRELAQAVVLVSVRAR